jgi:hypothetical protein
MVQKQKKQESSRLLLSCYRGLAGKSIVIMNNETRF